MSVINGATYSVCYSITSISRIQPFILVFNKFPALPCIAQIVIYDELRTTAFFY